MRKIIHFLLLICFLEANFSYVAQAQYIVKSGGLSQDEVLDIASDATGNTYVTGYFGSSLSFAGGISVSSSGLSDIFLVKTNNAGQVQWAVKGGGTADERGNAVCVDNSGNVYITGYFQGTINFGATSLTSAGAQDIFTAKYDNNGTLQWVKRAGGTGTDISNGIAVDNSGNVVISGEIKNTADFGSIALTAQASDAFICKYDANGNVLWAKNGAGADNSRGLDVAVDPAGNIYGVGQFSNDITFDVLQSNNILNAIYLVKLNASGSEQWFRKIGGAASNIAYSIDVDASSNVYMTGDFTGNMVFFPNTGSPLTNTYPNRIFIAKYNTGGNLQWSKAAGSASEVSAKKIVLGPSGELYIGGWFKCTMSEYSGAYGAGTFNSVGFKDGFVARYDQSAGSFTWARNMGGRKDDYVTGVAPGTGNMPYVSSVFVDDLRIPYYPALNYTYDPNVLKDTATSSSPAYCGGNYNRYLFSNTNGGTDIMYGNLIDPSHTPYDYYFRIGSGCSLGQEHVCITDFSQLCPDTIKLCNSGKLHVFPYTTWAGPDFTYHWSNSGTDSVTTVSASGVYTVTQTSADGCYVTTDDVYVNVKPNPTVPTISDNVPVNTNATFAQTVKVCYPDSVILTGSTNGATSYHWSNNPNNSSTTSVSGMGSYYLTYTTTNQYGCSSSNAVQVQILPPLPPIDPSLYFFSDFDMNDSMSLCGQGTLQIGLMDGNTNTIISCDLYNLVGDVTVNNAPMGNYTFCNNVGLALYGFQVDSTGWYRIAVHLRQSNLCDTVYYDLYDSIYVEVFPLPQANLNLSGPQYMCANDTIFITATADVPFTWGGNYTYLVSPNVAAVTEPGLVLIIANLTDPVTGCQATIQDTLMVSYVVPPNIVANPGSGIICPNDSLLLTVTNPQYYDSFVWIGPQGQIGGNTPSIYVTETGLYYCIATNAGGCSEQSNSIEVYQYGTPYLTAFPSTRLCPGADTILVHLVTPANSVIQWMPPLSGSDTVQVITAPGVYAVEVNSCGVTTVTDIEITMSDLFAKITTDKGLTFCVGDSVKLESTNVGAISFQWNPNGGTQSSFVAHQSGSYTLTVQDSAGCTFTSQAVVVVATPDNVPPPVISDTTFCPPASLLLSATGMGTIYWFENPSATPVDSGTTFQTPQLPNATSYYLQSFYGGCYSEFEPVNLDIASCDELTVPNIFTPNGDGANDYVDFSIDGTTCFYVEVRNRWGVKVFESSDPHAKWYATVLSSGTHVVDGVYFYIIEYCPHTGGKKEGKGTITVVRH